MSSELRETFVDVLSRLLDPDLQQRQLAEQQLKALQVTEEYGVILTQITLNGCEQLSLRQMTAVLLKQYVDSHWNSLADKFVAPEVTPEAKAVIRQELPQGIREPISKVRSSVAYTIATIAHWDWPEEWPELFDILMAALKPGLPDSEFAVSGSVRVLKEFARDLTDTQIEQVAPSILPDMYQIFMEMDRYSVRTRSRAIEIFTTMVKLICSMSGLNKDIGKSLLVPLIRTFTEALVTALHVPDDSHITDAGLKTEVLKALTALLSNVPKSMGPYQAQIIAPVWKTLTNTAVRYVQNVVNLSGDAEEEAVDSDGQVLSLDNLVFAIFDIVQALIEAPKYQGAVRGGLANLLYYIVLYMQITEDQREKWSENPDDFVEEEDEATYSYSVRISARELLGSLSEEFAEEFCDALAQAAERHLQETETAKQNGDPNWWKVHEALMLALGSVQEEMVSYIESGQGKFNLGGFLQNVVLSDLVTPGASPFLCGRCLWIGSKFPEVMPEVAMPQFLEATVRGLQPDQPMTVRINAVRATWGFCTHLKGRPERSGLLQPLLPATLDALINICTTFNTSSEVQRLVLDNLSVVLGCDKNFTASVEAKVSPLIIAIFLKYNSDPELVGLTQEVFKVISQTEGCLQPLQTRLVPTLVSIMDAENQKVANGLQAVALDVLQTLVRASQPQGGNQGQLSELLMHSAFPAAVRCTLKTDDNSIMQSGGECLRAYISVSPDQVCCFTDSEGKSGLWYLVQVAGQLLNPTGSEFTATFVGRLVITLIQKTGDRLGEHLELLLKAVLSKLQGSQTLSVNQSLLMVYAHLIHSQLPAVLNFLSSVPGPTGESALAFVLREWVLRQHVFYGAFENKVSITALAKLLQHGVNANDTRLQEIMVKGDLIIPQGTLTNDGRGGAKTRAATKKMGPEQYTTIPVLAKIFKLLVNEMANNLSDALASSQVDAEDDDEDNEEAWEDEDGGMDSGIGSASNGNDGAERAKEKMLLSQVFDTAYALYQDEDEEDDPDAVADPIYKINLRQYLTEFLAEFCKQPYFPHFAEHLSETEKKSLATIGVVTS